MPRAEVEDERVGRDAERTSKCAAEVVPAHARGRREPRDVERGVARVGVGVVDGREQARIPRVNGPSLPDIEAEELHHEGLDQRVDDELPISGPRARLAREQPTERDDASVVRDHDDTVEATRGHRSCGRDLAHGRGVELDDRPAEALVERSRVLHARRDDDESAGARHDLATGTAVARRPCIEPRELEASMRGGRATDRARATPGPDVGRRRERLGRGVDHPSRTATCMPANSRRNWPSVRPLTGTRHETRHDPHGTPRALVPASVGCRP